MNKVRRSGLVSFGRLTVTCSDIVRQANDTRTFLSVLSASTHAHCTHIVYGLAAAIFSKDITRAIGTAHKLKSGAVWVDCHNVFHPAVPFGGVKQSGIGRELGEYAIHQYV